MKLNIAQIKQQMFMFDKQIWLAVTGTWFKYCQDVNITRL